MRGVINVSSIVGVVGRHTLVMAAITPTKLTDVFVCFGAPKSSLYALEDAAVD